MTIDSLRNLLPEWAKDLKLNLSSVMQQTELTEMQRWACALAAATASRNPEVYVAVLANASEHLSPIEIDSTLGVTAVTTSNNIYYRFAHLAKDEELLKQPARLRMNALRPITEGSLNSVDVELVSLAVSAVNGCGMCIESHYRQLREKDMSRESILAAVRIGATVSAVAAILQVTNQTNQV